ncbi:hypothetical protein [Gimesia fumaroli]|uniref:Uncharacterized protein n=1 Tax=Gimesia fumaroli TaxID=2527976 RepID=A0A518IGD1_9PLAN|nr:hypothetical protein [Gimesia fumaroli]QDV52146.1 hypothetical protein Enr17x_42060 [Gimesia fumaroli]
MQELPPLQLNRLEQKALLMLFWNLLMQGKSAPIGKSEFITALRDCDDEELNNWSHSNVKSCREKFIKLGFVEGHDLNSSGENRYYSSHLQAKKANHLAATFFAVLASFVLLITLISLVLEVAKSIVFIVSK